MSENRGSAGNSPHPPNPSKPHKLDEISSCDDTASTWSTGTKTSGYSSNTGYTTTSGSAEEAIPTSMGPPANVSVPEKDSAPNTVDSSVGSVENSSGSKGTGSSSGTATTASPLLSSVGGTGSSGQTATPSSGGTGGTNSSADTVPISSQTPPEEEEGEKYWGILTPMQSGFVPMKLVKDEKHIFGRAKKAHYSFNIPSIVKTKYYSTFSKSHFAISRVLTEDGSTDQIFIQDLGGMNGTYVNGERLAPNSKILLPNRSKIAIAHNLNDILLFEGNTTSNEYPPEITEKYVICRQLGTGACSQVMEAWTKDSLQKCAIKIIPRAEMGDSAMSGISQKDRNMEAKILRKLKHPCIIDIHDVISTDQSIFIVLEYAAGGDLFSQVKKGKIAEPLTKLYFYQMVTAVHYLHSNGITHRDLKPENILLMSSKDQCLIKITDFGMSCLVNETSLMKTIAGTPTYVAPEIVGFMQKDVGLPTGYTKQVDMWSLGVILYVCLAAYPPFVSTDKSNTSIYEKILIGNYRFDKNRWSGISDKAKNLISMLLKLDPTHRLTAEQTIKNIWFNDAPVMKKANELMKLNCLVETKNSDVPSSSQEFKPAAGEKLKRHHLTPSSKIMSIQKDVEKENDDGPTRPKQAKS